MEKFLPLYSWDLNHVIQLYAYSLHGHVTTIQMQSIDFTPTTKNMNYSWQFGYSETVMDHELVQYVHILWNFNLWKERILNHFMTAEFCWKRLKGVFNLKWNFFGKRWDEFLLIFRLYTLMLVLLDAGFVDSYLISHTFWSQKRNILHFSQILTSITMWWITGFRNYVCGVKQMFIMTWSYWPTFLYNSNNTISWQGHTILNVRFTPQTQRNCL